MEDESDVLLGVVEDSEYGVAEVEVEIAEEEEEEEEEEEDVVEVSSASEAEVSGDDDDDDEEEEEEDDDEEDEGNGIVSGEDSDAGSSGTGLGKRQRPGISKDGMGKRRKIAGVEYGEGDGSSAEEDDEEDDEEAASLSNVTSTDPELAKRQFLTYLSENGVSATNVAVTMYPQQDGGAEETIVVPEFAGSEDEVRIVDVHNLAPKASFKIHSVTARAFQKEVSYKPAFLYCYAEQSEDDYHYLIVVE